MSSPNILSSDIQVKKKNPRKIKIRNIHLEYIEEQSSSTVDPYKSYNNLGSIEDGKIINLNVNGFSQSFTVIGKLGEGGFGKVYKCINSYNNEYALKKIESRRQQGIPCLMEASMMTVYNNIYLNRALSINASIDGLYILEDIAECDLRRWISINHNTVTPEKLNNIFYGICKGLEYLHSMGIVHGDVKASNILYYKEDIFKLTDFNLTTYVSWQSKIHLCTATHRPFELWAGLKWDTKIDIWALGCTMFEVKYGYNLIPYQGKDSSKYKKAYINSLIDWAKYNNQSVPRQYSCSYKTPKIPKDINNKSDMYINLMLRCLELYPKNRPLISTILHDPYFSKYQNITLTVNSLENNNEMKKNPFYNLIENSLKSYVPVEDILLLELASKICYRYCNIVKMNNYLIKKASVWIAKKLIRADSYSQEITDSENHNKFLELEMDICNKLNFYLH